VPFLDEGKFGGLWFRYFVENGNMKEVTDCGSVIRAETVEIRRFGVQ
jgi:hypothetical protein